MCGSKSLTSFSLNTQLLSRVNIHASHTFLSFALNALIALSTPIPRCPTLLTVMVEKCVPGTSHRTVSGCPILREHCDWPSSVGLGLRVKVPYVMLWEFPSSQQPANKLWDRPVHQML